MTGRPVLLAVALTFGCAAPSEQPPPVPPAALADGGAVERPPIVVCLSVPGEQEDAVLAGVAGWRQVATQWRDWVVASDPDSAPCDLWVLEIGPYARVCDDMAASGCTGELGGLLNEDGGPATVFLVSGNYEWNPTAVVMHEIGHTLGLTHEDGGLMQAEWPPSFRFATWECPDERTVDRLGALGAAGGCELPAGVVR